MACLSHPASLIQFIVACRRRPAVAAVRLAAWLSAGGGGSAA
jgi:hypothetical protein